MINAIRTLSAKIITRPETTCDRPGEDFYAPEYVSSLSFAPVLFAKVCRAGRSVAPRFAGRYFDSFAFGLLLYPANLLDGSPESLACASCLDHTSILSMHPLGKDKAAEAEFCVRKDGDPLFTCSKADLALLEESVVLASSRIHLRTGDLVAAELSAPLALACRPSSFRLQASCNNETITDINIILNQL